MSPTLRFLRSPSPAAPARAAWPCPAGMARVDPDTAPTLEAQQS